MNFACKFNTFYQMFRLTGFWGVMTYKPVFKPFFSIASKIGVNLKNRCLKLNLKDYRNPVWFRYGSSNSTVFCRIFLQHEYSCVDDLEEPKLIIDCGANIGYSSIYFLNKYTNAHVIAVEPDSENFKVCEKNLFPYRGRVSLIRSAIWSHRTGLSVCREEGDGHEWGVQVKECRSGQPDI